MKKLAALSLLAVLTLSACGDKDDEKSTDKDTNEGTSQTTETTETTGTDGGEAPEASGDRPSVDEIVAQIEKGEKSSGIDVPDSLTQCLAEGLHDSDLSDEQVNDYMAGKPDKATTELMVEVTSECSGM